MVDAKHPDDRIGDLILGKWRVEELLGVGAMATVYAARHRNGKRFAIKVLHAHWATEPVVVQRFLREGYAANLVGHPAVVAAYDDNVAEDGCPFLVLDLVEGIPLDVVIDADGPMPVDRALGIADQILDALVAAHARGVLHRDLKPENLVLEPDGTIRILDFGIARIDEAEGVGPRLTLPGRAMGTPGYMAPEQAQGRWHRVDARTDLWSLGATMFALLTGRAVHVANNHHELLVATLTKPAPKLREVIPSIPARVATIVDRALEFNPGERFPSAQVMQEWVRDARVPLALPSAPYSQAPTVMAVASHASTEPPWRSRARHLGWFALASAILAASGPLGERVDPAHGFRFALAAPPMSAELGPLARAAAISLEAVAQRRDGAAAPQTSIDLGAIDLAAD
jgi:serine/threonine-protein kinase